MKRRSGCPHHYRSRPRRRQRVGQADDIVVHDCNDGRGRAGNRRTDTGVGECDGEPLVAFGLKIVGDGDDEVLEFIVGREVKRPAARLIILSTRGRQIGRGIVHHPSAGAEFADGHNDAALTFPHGVSRGGEFKNRAWIGDHRKAVGRGAGSGWSIVQCRNCGNTAAGNKVRPAVSHRQRGEIA